MDAILIFNEGNNVAPPPPPQPEQTPPPPPPQEPGEPEEKAGDVNVLMAILSYLSIFALIPFFVEKEDEFIQFHAKQGVTLMLAEIVLSFVFMFLAFIPVLGCIVALLELVLFFALLIFHIILMVKASKGEWYKIPYIYEYSVKFFN